MLLFIPFAWASHFHWRNDNVTFARELPSQLLCLFAYLSRAVCFLSIIPLERLFDYGGEQMAFYVGQQLGDLICITLNK